jgi:hypothetical protein
LWGSQSWLLPPFRRHFDLLRSSRIPPFPMASGLSGQRKAVMLKDSDRLV